MKIIRQVLAIARTEFRFGWRRGAPVISAILIGLILGAGLLLGPLANLSIARDQLQQVAQDAARLERMAELGITLPQYHRIEAEVMAQMTVYSIPMAWPILLITTFLLLPIAAAISLPADRKAGPDELLRSLPIQGGIYITGKFVGVLSTVVTAGLIPLGLFFVVLEAAVYTNLGAGLPWLFFTFFIRYSLLGVFPLFLWAIMVGILAGTPFRTRKAAIFPGLLAGILSIFFWLAVSHTGSKSWPAATIDLNTFALVRDYHSSAIDALTKAAGAAPYSLFGENPPVVSLTRLIGTNFLLVCLLLGMGALSRLWLYWKENF
jgi:hypothetical protein